MDILERPGVASYKKKRHFMYTKDLSITLKSTTLIVDRHGYIRPTWYQIFMSTIGKTIVSN